MPTAAISPSYDDVPYEGGIVAGTHPEHLAAIGRLFGVEAAPAESCSVLEIGCAAAGNLLPMAYGLPGSTFVGIDPSAKQIEMGRAVLEEYGVRNVELLTTDVREITRWDRKFDYIVCHGVFSWVAPDVREAILDACGHLLAPSGIAYVSYNTLPGFHARAGIGEMMRFHGLSFKDPIERAGQARALLNFLADATGRFDKSDGLLSAYHAQLTEERAFLNESRDWYVLHEHFAEFNDAFYLHEFVDMAAEHQLQYLGDSAFHTMLLNDLPTEVADGINAIAPSQVALEQYRDFVVNRMFRKTLLCRQDVDVARHISVGAIAGLSFRERIVHPSPGQQWRIVKTGGLKVNVNDSLVRKVLDTLAESAPLALSFDALRTELQRDGGETVADERLAAVLLSLYSLDAVDFRSWTPPMSETISERPKVFEPALRSAKGNLVRVPLPLHGNAELDPFVEAVLPYVDGTRTISELVETVARAIEDGSLRVRDVEPGDLPQRFELERLIKESLEELRRTGLLVG
jgi:methyltransferase-like protein/SAM-dependent methyltransferase